MSWKLHCSNLTWKVSYLVKNCLKVCTPVDLLDKLLHKISYSDLGRPMDLILRDSNCCSFHTMGSLLLPWHSGLRMTTPSKVVHYFWLIFSKTSEKTKEELLTNIDMLLMVEKVIRREICHTIYWYAKANNKYVKDNDKNK